MLGQQFLLKHSADMKHMTQATAEIHEINEALKDWKI